MWQPVQVANSDDQRSDDQRQERSNQDSVVLWNHKSPKLQTCQHSEMTVASPGHLSRHEET